MNTTEHLLQKLEEECAEVIKEASKCNLFGLDDVNAVEINTDPNWPKNRELLAQEIDDLLGVIEMLRERGILRAANLEAVRKKKEKVALWMDYARTMTRTLAPNSPIDVGWISGEWISASNDAGRCPNQEKGTGRRCCLPQGHKNTVCVW